MSADFHVHSENSVDSFVPLPVRVRAIAAEGLEFVVATDHDDDDIDPREPALRVVAHVTPTRLLG